MSLPAGAPGRRMSVSYWIGWSLFRLMFSTYFRRRVYHAERVPADGPVILAANHASFIDPPFIGSSTTREINYLARKSLFRFPIMGSVLRSWNTVPVDRDGGGGAGLKAILDRLHAGGAIILFPEGTRSEDGNLLPAKSGIGLTIIKSEAPVLPVRVFGTERAYGRRMRFPRPRRIEVKFGKPMLFEALRAEAKTCSRERLKQIYQEVSDAIMAEIAAMQCGPN